MDQNAAQSMIAFAEPSGGCWRSVHPDYKLDLLRFPVLVARLENTLGADDQFTAIEDTIFTETSNIVKVYEHGGR